MTAPKLSKYAREQAQQALYRARGLRAMPGEIGELARDAAQAIEALLAVVDEK